MIAFAVAALVLTQAPEETGASPRLELDLDYETAFATTTGDWAHERGETAAGVGTTWVALGDWRVGLEARISLIANDPFGSAVMSPNPFIADVLALVEHRFWIQRFAIGPQLGAGAEIYAGQGGKTGAVFEVGVESTFRFNETWSVHLRVAFSPTAGLEPVLGPQSYWRFVGGVEWSSPI